MTDCRTTVSSTLCRTTGDSCGEIKEVGRHLQTYIDTQRHQSIFRLCFIGLAVIAALIYAVVAKKPIGSTLWTGLVAGVVFSILLVLLWKCFVR